MASATGLFFTGQGRMFGGSLAGLFAVYGTGFVAMALTMVALYWECLRNEAMTRAQRAEALGERGIWIILAVTGIASILISLTRYGVWAAMAYATLPLTIGLYSRWHDWEGTKG